MSTKQPPHTSGTHCTHHARTAGSLCNTLYSLSAGTDNRPPTTSVQPVAARPRISRISEVYTHATEPSAVMISVSARAQDLKPPSELITSCPLCYTLLPPPCRAAQIRALGPARLWGLCDSLAFCFLPFLIQHQTRHTHRTHCTHTAGTLYSTLLLACSLSAGTDNHPPTKSSASGDW